ncbi:hypothetical protein KAI32_00880 [Candidatus Pacearchaeota archaeon]|nr:hypothetical protein [Candidatus Pacearchaeota archaeon]
MEVTWARVIAVAVVAECAELCLKTTLKKRSQMVQLKKHTKSIIPLKGIFNF